MTKSDMAVSKLFSAQWIMAVGVTIGATILAIWVVVKDSKYADTVLAVYFTNWGIIIACYFKRDRAEDVALKTVVKKEDV